MVDEIEKYAEQFCKDRKEAFTHCVKTGRLDKVKAYCKKYKVPFAADKPDIMRAAVYKAVQECTDIDDSIKKQAQEKCIKMGFTPFMFM